MLRLPFILSACSCVLCVAVAACSPSDVGSEQGLTLEIEEEDPEDLGFGDGGDDTGATTSGESDYSGDAGLALGDSDTRVGGDPIGPAAGSGGSTATGGAASTAMGGAGSPDTEASPATPTTPLLPPEIPDPVEPPTPMEEPPLDPETLIYGELTAGMFDDNRSFDFFRIYQKDMHEYLNGIMPFSLESDYLPVRLRYLDEQHERQKLDISIVLDTTGSMGDEIAYLQGEFLNLSGRINSLYPNAEQRWSLVVYRDRGDEYLSKTTKFTSQLSEFHDALLRQRANGGGDFPEAPDVGLAEAGQLDWREGDDIARLVFWVADAPPHEENAQDMADAIRVAQSKNVHIYPVGASGVDERTEFIMRASAQLTMGRYIFLTDDSGLGGAHKEPTLPCYYVTTLANAILRGVEAEMTGEYHLPDDRQVIRKEGKFNAEGVCAYGQRSETLAY